jgi:hypothetical protein
MAARGGGVGDGGTGVAEGVSGVGVEGEPNRAPQADRARVTKKVKYFKFLLDREYIAQIIPINSSGRVSLEFSHPE